jgi:MFS family permease
MLPAFRRLLLSYALNELVFWIGSLALSILVYQRTGSALAATAYFLARQFLPALISPAVVARLDRLPPRWVLPPLYALEALAFLLLAWLVSRFSLAPVLVVALIDGIIALVARSLAHAAAASVTIPLGLLRAGNAVINTTFSACFIAGPAVGGVLVSGGRTATALLINAGLLAVVGLILLTARSLPKPAQGSVPSASRLRAAFAYAFSRPDIRGLLGLQSAATVFFAMSIPVDVVFATHTLHAGAGGLGALNAIWGLGAVAGSAFYARFFRLPSGHLISLGAAALGFGFAVMAGAPVLAAALVGAALAGVGNGVEAIAVRTTLQEKTTDTWMAMMMSLTESLQQGVPGAGILLGGAVTALAGPRAAFAVAAAGAFMIALVTRNVLRARDASGALA